MKQIFVSTISPIGYNPNENFFGLVLILIVALLFYPVDGDGCVHVYKDRYKATVSMIGSKLFLEQTNQKIERNIQVSNFSFYPKGKIYYLTTTKHDNIIQLYHWLYDEATIFLERKKQKFIEYFEKKNEFFNSKNLQN